MSYGSFGNGSQSEGFWHHVTQVRLSRIILLVCFVLITVPLVTHYYLSKVSIVQNSFFLKELDKK